MALKWVILIRDNVSFAVPFCYGYHLTFSQLMSTVKEPPQGERTLVDGDALIASTDINSTPWVWWMARTLTL